MSVRTDVVNLTVNVNGNAAQNQLNDLRKSAADIAFEMKGLTKGTAEYLQKAAELKEVGAQMDALKSQIGITALSSKELRQEMAKLTALKGSVTPFTKEWKDYEEQLKKVKDRLAEVNNTSEGSKGIAEEFAKGFVIGDVVEKGADIVKEFLTGIPEEANKAIESTNELRNSLENAGRADLFQRFTDDAEKFADTYKRINVNDIQNVFTKLIDYGKLTQNQINQLTDVIINYAAKQKISVVEATDVFTKALEGNSKGLKTYGINIKDAGSFAERFGLIVNNLGQKVKGSERDLEETAKGGYEIFKEKIVQLQEVWGKFLFSVFEKPKSSDNIFDEAKAKAEEYTQSLQPLLNRYDELKSKTSLNKNEQTELHGIIQKIVQIMPQAAGEVDKYGNAMDINRTKVDDFLNSNKKFLAEKEYKAIQDLTTDIGDNLKTISQYAGQMNKGFIEISGRKANIDTKQVQASIDELQEKVLKNAETLKEKYGVELSKDMENAITAIKSRLEGLNKVETETPKLTKNYLEEELTKVNAQINNAVKGSKEFNDLLRQRDDITKQLKDYDSVIGKGSTDDDAAEAAKERKKKYDALKKEADQFYKDLLKLKANAEIQGEQPEQKEIDAIGNKYSELTAKAKNFFVQGIISKQIFGEEETLLEESKQKEINAIIAKYFKQRQDEGTKQQYQQSLEEDQVAVDQQKKVYAELFQNGKISKIEYEAALKDADSKGVQARINTAKYYSQFIKEAAVDVTKFTKEQEDKRTKDAEDAANKRAEFHKQAQEAEFQNRILATKKGTAERKKAELDALANQYKEEKGLLDQNLSQGLIAQKDYDVLKTKLDLEYADKKKQIDHQSLLDQIDNLTKYAQDFAGALDDLNKFITNRETRLYNQEVADNNRKKAAYQKQLDGKLISQEQYNLKTTKADADLDAQQKQMQHDQAIRQRDLELFKAIITVPRAVAEALPNIPLAIATGIMGALQIAAIATEPIPEAGTGKWFTTGDKHSDPSGGINVKIERDESVINAKAMTDKNVYTVTGTPAQITGALNNKGGGPNWAGGGVIQMADWLNARQGNISPAMPRIMEQGGIVRPLNITANPQPGQQDSSNSGIDKVASLLQKNNELSEQHIQETVKGFKDRRAIVSVKEFRKQSELYDAAIQTGALKQNNG